MVNYTDAIAGAFQATIVTTVGHPFDTVKVRMQAGNFKSTPKCLRHILSTQGLLGLYKGVSMPFMSHISKRPTQFGIAEYLKRNYQLSNYLVGVLQAPFSSTIGIPFQVIKIRAQNEGIRADLMIQTIYRQSGYKGFYRGLFATCAKDMAFGCSYLGHYYTLRDRFGCKTPFQSFTNAVTANCLTWITLIPIDYVKTNIQKSSVKSSVYDLIKHSYKKSGVLVFWSGLQSMCLRTMPVSGISMVGYEYVRAYLTKNK